MIRWFVWTVVLGLGWTSTARSEPLKFDQVPANVKWVAHLDADAARASKVMNAVLKSFLNPSDLAAIREASHTSPCSAVQFEKLRSVTLYGSRLGLRHGVAIVRGEWDKPEFLRKLNDAVKVTSANRGGREVYTWTKYQGSDLAHEVALAFPAENLLVFASGVEELDKALAVLDGKAEHLDKASPIANKAPEGAILLARASGLKDTDVGADLKFFRLIQGFDYFAAENGGRWTESVTISASSEPVAENFRKAFDGMIGMSALCFHEWPKLVNAIEQTQIGREGRTVRLQYSESAEEVAGLVKPALEAMRTEWETRLGLIRRLLGERTMGNSKPAR